jgi:hypothetical protein
MKGAKSSNTTVDGRNSIFCIAAQPNNPDRPKWLKVYGVDDFTLIVPTYVEEVELRWGIGTWLVAPASDSRTDLRNSWM